MSNNLNQPLPAWNKEEFAAEQMIGFLLAELVKGQLSPNSVPMVLIGII